MDSLISGKRPPAIRCWGDTMTWATWTTTRDLDLKFAESSDQTETFWSEMMRYFVEAFQHVWGYRKAAEDESNVQQTTFSTTKQAISVQFCSHSGRGRLRARIQVFLPSLWSRLGYWIRLSFQDGLSQSHAGTAIVGRGHRAICSG